MLKRPTTFLCTIASLSLFQAGCNRPTAAAPTAAPAAEKAKSEVDWTHTSITDEAYKSLKIRSAPVVRREVQEHVKATGNIVAPQGAEVLVTAPLAGYIRMADGQANFPVPGTQVVKDHTLLRLDPVLSPVEYLQMASQRRAVENELAKATDSRS